MKILKQDIFAGGSCIATLALGMGLLFSSFNIEKRYGIFLNETSKTVPQLTVIKTLENSSKYLDRGSEELSLYRRHDPSRSASIGFLEEARADIGELESKSLNNKTIRGIDDQIQQVIGELFKMKEWESEDYYLTQRKEINLIKNEIIDEIKDIKAAVPTSILSYQDKLKNSIDERQGLATMFIILGSFSCIMYWGMYRTSYR
jgi:hypothetical protein